MNRFSLIYLFLLAMVFTACEEEDRAFPEFGDDDVQTGAFARQLTDVDGIFDFFNIDDSEISFDVEFYDVNEGRDVSEYSWTATFRPAEGDPVGPVPVLTIPRSEFTTTEFGTPGATVRFDLSDVLDQLGVARDSVDGGDAVRFESTITLDDGRTFTRANTGGNVISGAAFLGAFILDQTIVCPSDIGGTYSYTTTVPSDWPDGCAAGTMASGEVELTETAEGLYQIDDFSFGGYTVCYGGGDPAGTLRLQDACNTLSITGVDSFGDGYTISNIVVDGPSISFQWESAYGEIGNTTLTRTDGADLPPLN